MMVIKVGGGAGVDLEAVADDVAGLVKGGTELVLVHGGSHLTNEVAAKLGHPPRFITSPSGHTSRRTDRRTLEIFEMVYCGRVNKELVELLQRRGVNAVGLSGLDGRIWEGPRKSVIRSVENGRTRVIRDDYTGKVERVNTALLRALAAQGCLPVLTPPAASLEGEAINVDGDRAAAMTAAALGADTLIILSNVPGLLRNFPDESSLIARIDRRRLERFEDFAKGRMKKKILGAREALDGGVRRVIIGDARGAGPVAAALREEGTVIQ